MPRFVGWLIRLPAALYTHDSKSVDIVEIRYKNDDKILSEWAAHLREQYCANRDINALCEGTGLSRSRYLSELVFPDQGHIISADFAEILVADYIQFCLGYIVPRIRYEDKIRKNSSPFGIDILAYKIKRAGESSPEDILLTCEVKAALQKPNTTTLKRAIADSINDFLIKRAESLNATKRRMIKKGENAEAQRVQRFQSKADNPFVEISGAAAVHSDHTWDTSVVTDSKCSDHPNAAAIFLLVLRGRTLMDLARVLYKRACDET